MSQPPPSSTDAQRIVEHFVLLRKKVDFPLGPGAWLIDVDVSMVWAGPQADSADPQKPRKFASQDDAEGMVAGAVLEGNLGGVVEAVQAEKQ